MRKIKGTSFALRCFHNDRTLSIDPTDAFISKYKSDGCHSAMEKRSHAMDIHSPPMDIAKTN